MGAQEATSRALAQASTPYQQSATRVDITAPRPCTPVYSAEEDEKGYWPWSCSTHRMLTHMAGPDGVCDGRFEAWAPEKT